MAKKTRKSKEQGRKEEASAESIQKELKMKLRKKKKKAAEAASSAYFKWLLVSSLVIVLIAAIIVILPEPVDTSYETWKENVDSATALHEAKNDIAALEHFQKAFEVRHYEPAWLSNPALRAKMVQVGISIATVAGYIGYSDVQLQSLQDVIEYAPQHPLANFRLVDVHEKTMSKDKRYWTDSEMEHVASILEVPNLDPTDKCRVYKTLSLMHKHRGELHQAYLLMRDANACKRILNPASLEGFPQRQMDRNAMCKDADPVAMATKNPNIPVFDSKNKSKQLNTYEIVSIISAPRSGSSLLESKLFSHSQIGTVGETVPIRQARTRANNKLDVQEIKQEFYQHIIPANLLDSRPISGLKYVVDKTTFVVDILTYWQILPNSKTLILRRAPLDIIWSIWENHFENTAASWSTELQVILDMFVNFFNSLEMCVQGFMDAGNADHIKVVWHEDQINDLEGSMREIIVDHLGLEWENNVITGDVSWNTRVRTASQKQVRGAVSSVRLNRWRRSVAYLLEQAEYENIDFEYLVQIVQNFSNPATPEQTQDDLYFLRQAIADYKAAADE